MPMSAEKREAKVAEVIARFKLIEFPAPAVAQNNWFERMRMFAAGEYNVAIIYFHPSDTGDHHFDCFVGSGNRPYHLMISDMDAALSV